MDGDGDLDVIAGSRGENRMILFENVSDHAIRFEEHPITVRRSASSDQKGEYLSNQLPYRHRHQYGFSRRKQQRKVRHATDG